MRPHNLYKDVSEGQKNLWQFQKMNLKIPKKNLRNHEKNLKNFKNILNLKNLSTYLPLWIINKNNPHPNPMITLFFWQGDRGIFWGLKCWKFWYFGVSTKCISKKRLWGEVPDIFNIGLHITSVQKHLKSNKKMRKLRTWGKKYSIVTIFKGIEFPHNDILGSCIFRTQIFWGLMCYLPHNHPPMPKPVKKVCMPSGTCS